LCQGFAILRSECSQRLARCLEYGGEVADSFADPGRVGSVGLVVQDGLIIGERLSAIAEPQTPFANCNNTTEMRQQGKLGMSKTDTGLRMSGNHNFSLVRP
jgi:hypothetical protein